MDSTRVSRGFTLVEILVVIVIIGIVLSVALLSFGLLRDDRAMRTEATRFIALSNLVLDEASMQGREFGIELLRQGYRFVEYDVLAAQWADVPADDTLRLRQLPEDMELALYIEGQEILLDDDPAPFSEDESENDRTNYTPHLLIYSSGDATPFEVLLTRQNDDTEILLRGDALGFVEIVNEEEL